MLIAIIYVFICIGSLTDEESVAIWERSFKASHVQKAIYLMRNSVDVKFALLSPTTVGDGPNVEVILEDGKDNE